MEQPQWNPSQSSITPTKTYSIKIKKNYARKEGKPPASILQQFPLSPALPN